jgi:hypothetical protein
MRAVIDEPEDLRHEPRLATADTRGPAGLAQVLTRETRGDDVCVRKLIDVAHIADELDAAEVLAKNILRGRPDLAEQACLESGLVQSELDSADSGEQSDGTRLRSMRIHDGESTSELGWR